MGLLIGDELLQIQGFPIRELTADPAIKAKWDALSNTTKCELAGNCFAAGSYMSVLLAVILELPRAAWEHVRTGAMDCDDDNCIKSIQAARGSISRS